MLENPLQQIAGHADVKRVAPTGRDVGAIDPLSYGENLSQLVNDCKERYAGPHLRPASKDGSPTGLSS